MRALPRSLCVAAADGAAGRTGRFGRKGISINFVHDKRTWQQMEQIEKATGKEKDAMLKTFQIVRLSSPISGTLVLTDPRRN